MSYGYLFKKLESTGKVKLKGGQVEGRVVATNSNTSHEPKIPTRGKGAEYAAKFRAEEERNFIELQKNSVIQGLARLDVTQGQTESQMEQLEELTSIGTLPNLRELNREELTQVYSRYNFDPPEPTDQLENIFNQKQKILELIETNQVCIIKGPTGCGKSTQIPQFILDSKAAELKHCNIVVTQPRRIAAITIAQRVCKERNWGEPGGLVGYQVGLDRKADEDTRLLYCTTGVLLEKLINAKHMNDFTHVILDEVHEREEDMDFLMLVVRKFLRTNSSQVKVVLMSATIDTNRFAKYFGIFIRNKIEPTVSYSINQERKFAVQVHYLDVLHKLANLPTFDFYKEEEPGIPKEAYDMVPMMIRAFNLVDSEDFTNKRSSDMKGAVLIFLPGLHQIEILHEILSNEDEKQRQQSREKPDFLNLWLCPLHSSITKDEQEKVTSFAPHGKRKVILSTNIAESSLTIPDVKYVIDFCLTKHLVADNVTGFTSLRLAWASHTNCIQREGRVGRVQNGRVYRMVPKDFYQFHLPKESVPEMQRCPLEIIVLKCKRLMEEECPIKLISNALDPPDLDNYEKTILKLKEIGALLMTCRDEMTDQDGDITFLGRLMGSLPLDIRITKLILLGHLFDVLEEAIIMGCAMSLRNIFSEPFQRRLDAYNNKLLWADLSESDAIAYLNAYTVWRQLTGLGKFDRSRSNEKNWGRMYMLQIKHLKDVALQEDDIKRRLKRFNIQVARYKNKPLWNAKEKPLILKIVLAGAFYPNYYSCNSENPNAEMDAVKTIGGHDPYRSVYIQNMAHPAPLYFDQVKQLLQQNNISDNFELHYDSSQKLIVEFNQVTQSAQDVGNKEMHADIPGNIVMPVYRAVKMRQLGLPLPIRIFSSAVAKEKLNSLVLNSKSSMMSLSAQSSDYKPAIRWDQQIVEVVVCHVENAGNFYGHIHPSAQENLSIVHNILNKSNFLCELYGEVEESNVYMAPFQDEGEVTVSYYRAKVVKKYVSYEKTRVDVFFIDFGNYERGLPTSELREIVNEEAQKVLDKIPALATKFVLAEVGPSVWNNVSGHWSKDATTFVKNIFTKQNLWPMQVYSFVNGIAHVYMFIEDEGKNGELPLTLNSLLVKKGFAIEKEEDYLSKRNHAKREEIAKGEQIVDNIDENNLFKSMGKDLMALPISDGSVRYLKGPHSPLEMKLYSKVRCSVQKEIRVEWNSVNSVLLDSDPNEPYEKLMVAGFVTQSADRCRLMLNHTTLLPNLNGLAALVCLLFAPSVELRCDEYMSRYIGALCGLGSDPNTGEPIFPENDMEIKFDMEITDTDLITVNKVRYFLNQRFCGNDSEDMPEHQVFTLQRNIKDLILRLLSTQRKPVKVVHCSVPYRWNQVKEAYLLEPFDQSVQELCEQSSVYHLFRAIQLNPKNDFMYIQDLVKKVKNLMECAQKDITPKELICHLCDVDFSYWIQLRHHVTTGHHKSLLRWLKTRAADHRLSLEPVRPTVVPSTSQPTTSRPTTNRPTTNRPTTSRPTTSRPTTSRY